MDFIVPLLVVIIYFGFKIREIEKSLDEFKPWKIAISLNLENIIKDFSWAEEKTKGKKDQEQFIKLLKEIGKTKKTIKEKEKTALYTYNSRSSTWKQEEPVEEFNFMDRKIERNDILYKSFCGLRITFLSKYLRLIWNGPHYYSNLDLSFLIPGWGHIEIREYENKIFRVIYKENFSDDAKEIFLWIIPFIHFSGDKKFKKKLDKFLLEEDKCKAPLSKYLNIDSYWI